MKHPIYSIAAALILSACVSGPIISHGEATLGGKPAKATANIASLTARDVVIRIEQNKTICTGTFSNYALKPELSLPITCNDGRTATGKLIRSNGYSSIHLTFTLNDGTNGKAAIGNASL